MDPAFLASTPAELGSNPGTISHALIEQAIDHPQR